MLKLTLICRRFQAGTKENVDEATVAMKDAEVGTDMYPYKILTRLCTVLYLIEKNIILFTDCAGPDVRRIYG